MNDYELERDIRLGGEARHATVDSASLKIGWAISSRECFATQASSDTAQNQSPPVAFADIDNAYPEGSEIATYVQSRVNFLADIPINVYVIHNAQGVPDAYANNNGIFITDGLLQIVQSEEEIDFVLAHEIVHIEREHVNPDSEIHSEISASSLGGKRRGEIEADLGAIRRLEERGINPLGAIKLFEKFQEKELEPGYRQRTKFGDPIHGSITDRLLTIREGLKHFDSRGIGSGNLKPLPVKPESYISWENDIELFKRYNTLSSSEKAHLLYRHSVKPGRKILETKESINKWTELLLDQDPTINQATIDKLLVLIGAKALDQATDYRPTKEFLEETITTSRHPALAQLAIPHRSKRVNSITHTTLRHLTEPGKEDYAEFQDAVDTLEAHGIKVEPLAESILIERTIDSCLTGETITEEALDLLANSKVMISKIYMEASSIVGYKLKYNEMDTVSPEAFRRFSYIGQEIGKRRLDTALKIADENDFLKYVANHSTRNLHPISGNRLASSDFVFEFEFWDDDRDLLCNAWLFNLQEYFLPNDNEAIQAHYARNTSLDEEELRGRLRKPNDVFRRAIKGLQKPYESILADIVEAKRHGQSKQAELICCIASTHTRKLSIAECIKLQYLGLRKKQF